MVQEKEIKPLVSIILPVYNVEKYLEACLKSILSQTYKYIEVIAIDDFSHDKSFAILKQYAKQDHRIKVWRNVKKYGRVITLNRGIKHAKGKFIAFAKSEDTFHPARIEKQLAFLQSNEKTVGIGTQCIYLDKANKRLGKSTFPQDYFAIYKKPLDGITLQFETLLINKYRIPKDLLYFHTNQQSFIYSDLYVKLLQYGQLTNLPDVLYYHKQLDKVNHHKRHFPSLVRLWLRAGTLFDYRPPVRLFVFSFLRLRVS